MENEIDKLVREIADELFTVFTGKHGGEIGNRLAVKQGKKSDYIYKEVHK